MLALQRGCEPSPPPAAPSAGSFANGERFPVRGEGLLAAESNPISAVSPHHSALQHDREPGGEFSPAWDAVPGEEAMP